VRSFPNDPEGEENVSRDFAAVGVGSILAALIGAFAVDTSPPRTAVVEESGGRSKLAGLLAIALVAAIALRPPARSPASDSGSARLARVALVCMVSPAPGTDCAIRPRDDIACHAQATARFSCIGRNTTSAALAATQQDLVTHLADRSPGSVGNAPITAGPRC
jgi:DNA-binding transcriptional LysR family regulator